MSKCISSHGEYSEHEPGDPCPYCGEYDMDRIVAERDQAEAQVEIRDAAITDARSHARRIIAHPDRWITQDLVDATSNMLSALKSAPTVKGGAVQWKDRAVAAEARADQAEAKVRRMREVIASHPTPDCEQYPGGGDSLGSCGWKSAYAGVIWALDGDA